MHIISKESKGPTVADFAVSHIDSIECRKYQKLKSSISKTFGAANLVRWALDYQELMHEEGDLLVTSIKDFLDSRIAGYGQSTRFR